MNATSADFLDLRAPARLGVMRRAVAFSLVLHSIHAVGVGLYWHKRVVRTSVRFRLTK